MATCAWPSTGYRTLQGTSKDFRPTALVAPGRTGRGIARQVATSRLADIERFGYSRPQHVGFPAGGFYGDAEQQRRMNASRWPKPYPDPPTPELRNEGGAPKT